MAVKIGLTTCDRFEIFEQLNLHQYCIDNDSSLGSVRQYIDLYWPEARFTVHDLRTEVFDGPQGLKKLYDYAHTVFPLEKWRHSLGTFRIEGTGEDASVVWRWIVSWKADKEGVVSTGTYTDRFQKRNGQWKCLERISDIDPNWPSELFKPYVDDAQALFKSS
jgi:hypothetical protein